LSAADLSDTPEIGGLNSAPGSDSQHAINYSTLASAAAAAGAVAPGVGVGVGVDPSISSTETLLRNIQGLLKVAADNARQQERQINYEKSEYLLRKFSFTDLAFYSLRKSLPVNSFAERLRLAKLRLKYC
jgi:alkanesulfonate monooxygenase SsuD/methylene tetrahydromethanopterin reductase-like flavin-dependent oxidoreductase (luciferase family)